MMPKVMLFTALLACSVVADQTQPALTPGNRFTVTFPEMPTTFHARAASNNVPAQMTVFLPRNYDLNQKFPLLVFLNGGDGGNASIPGVARGITKEMDFICAVMPLFKTNVLNYVMRDEDAQFMWPHFRTMLERLDALVPNIDKSCQILGGFSNGAHAAAGLIDMSDGEVARRFSAVFFVEGGGRLMHYDLLAGKPFLMVSSNIKSKPRAEEIRDAAKLSGAITTFICHDVGSHDFPQAAYPAVLEWLRNVTAQPQK